MRHNNWMFLMPKLSDHHSSTTVKLILIGDSGTGKTGSLVSLLAEGYKLRILDMDNGLDSLVQWGRRIAPDKLSNVEFETVRDNYKASTLGPVIAGQPKAFLSALQLMTKWSDGTAPSEWDSSTVFIIDSLTALSKSAFDWAKGMNPTAKDPRQWYFSAQQALENIIAMVTSESFKPNVIIISHVTYKELADGTTKGYTSSIGSALGPTIPKYFNTLLLAESVGSGTNVKRTIKTLPTGVIDLKTPIPFKLPAALPLDTGIAEVFKQLKSS